MAQLRIWTCLAVASLCIGAAAHWHEDTDSIIVKLESDPKAMETAAFSVQSAAAADAAGALGQPIGRHLRRIRLQTGEKMDHRLEHLRSLKGVKYAVPDLRITPERVKIDAAADAQAAGIGEDAHTLNTLRRLPLRPSFKFQWGAARVGLPDAWSIATGASSRAKAVKVCVVDSGAELSHPGLRKNMGRGFSAVDGDDEDSAADQVGHGTTVQGVIAASGDDGGILGVNWGEVDVLPCKFMSADGWGKTSDAVQCLDWCLQQGAAIISASWTCGELGNPPLEEAVARTRQAGALLVVAAGNQGADMARTPYYPQAYAAAYDNLLVVAASDEYDEHAFFSNRDPATVHLSAPGHWIYSTAVGGAYNFSSGTSIAAPFVSGAAALLQAVAQERLGRTLSALELKAALMESAEEVAALKGKTATGARLRIDWALQRLLKLQLSPPAPCVARPGDRKKCKEEEGGAEGGAGGGQAGAVEARSLAPRSGAKLAAMGRRLQRS